jgi:hypothetical protein
VLQFFRKLNPVLCIPITELSKPGLLCTAVQAVYSTRTLGQGVP